MPATPEPPPQDALAVRVWIARRRQNRNAEGLPTGPALSRDAFLTALRQTFVPATVQLMAPLGLCAYFPTLPPAVAVPPGNPSDDLPEETALVFYTSREAYDTARQTPVGRLYAESHRLYFDALATGWPERWQPGEDSVPRQAYCGPAHRDTDWNTGQVWTFLLAWSVAPDTDNWMRDLCAPCLAGIAPVSQWVAHYNNGRLVVWFHSPQPHPLQAGQIRQAIRIADLPGAPATIYLHAARDEPVTLPTTPGTGVNFHEDETLHIRFTPPADAPSSDQAPTLPHD